MTEFTHYHLTDSQHRTKGVIPETGQKVKPQNSLSWAVVGSSASIRSEGDLLLL